MRNYPCNSPEAAARIVALVLIADGHVSRDELAVLETMQVEQALGLPPGGFGALVRHTCEDLMLGAYGHASLVGQVDEQALDLLLDEVADPVLQQRTLQLAAAVALADQHMADAECVVLEAARRRWHRTHVEALHTAPLMPGLATATQATQTRPAHHASH